MIGMISLKKYKMYIIATLLLAKLSGTSSNSLASRYWALKTYTDYLFFIFYYTSSDLIPNCSFV